MAVGTPPEGSKSRVAESESVRSRTRGRLRLRLRTPDKECQAGWASAKYLRECMGPYVWHVGVGGPSLIMSHFNDLEMAK